MEQFNTTIIMATIINCTGCILININHPFMGSIFLLVSLIVALSGLLMSLNQPKSVERAILDEILKQTYIMNKTIIELEIERRKDLKKTKNSRRRD